MIYCSFCRDLKPAACPSCDNALRANDNESIPEQDIVEEIFRDPGEERIATAAMMFSLYTE